VNWTPGAATLPGITSFTLTIRNAAGTALASPAPITNIAPGATSRVVTGLTNGTSYTFTVKAVSAAGTGPDSARSNVVTPTAPPAPPAAPTGLTAARNGSGSVLLTWTAPTGPITGYQVQVRNILGIVIRTDNVAGAVTSTPVTGLTNGTTYSFRVRAVNAGGNGALSTPSALIQAGAVPGAPVIGAVARGAIGAPVTATVNWAAPATNGGLAITSYRVRISVMSSALASATEVSFTTQTVGAAVRQISPTLTANTNYRFSVVATNAAGTGPRSAISANVVPR
jgi:hypothetical protein